MNDSIAYIGLLADEEIELDSAALALSALDHQGTSIDPYIEQLRAMSAALDSARSAMDEDDLQSGEDQGALLAQVIGQDHDFDGDDDSYDAPINADMMRVLDRRRGLPVSLSILYVAAARRMGWTAHALNTPSHVLVSIGPDEAPALIDPFRRGAMVPPEQLLALFDGALGPDARPTEIHVAPMSNRMTLVRLLLNQATRAEEAGDIARAATLFGRVTVIAPEHDAGWWELARLQLLEDDVDGARSSLTAMLEITRDPQRRAHVNLALTQLSGRPTA